MKTKNNTPTKRLFPIFDQRQAKAAFLNLFGSRSWLVVLLTCLTLIFFNWFSDGFLLLVVNISKEYLLPKPPQSPWCGIIGRLALFPFILGIWWLLLRKSFKEVAHMSIREQIGPPPCKILILFLSPPGKDQSMIKAMLKDTTLTHPDDPGDKKVREKFKGPWRMPIEAINYHVEQGTLTGIMLIPSATVKTSSNTIQQGTRQNVSEFRKLINYLFRNRVEVYNAGDADKTSWQDGVNFESAKKIRDCLADIFLFLTGRGYLEEDILIDITSGQKVCSSVSTVVSLQQGRQIEYVSTVDYSIKSYDIDYEVA